MPGKSVSAPSTPSEVGAAFFGLQSASGSTDSQRDGKNKTAVESQLDISALAAAEGKTLRRAKEKISELEAKIFHLEKSNTKGSGVLQV